MTLNTTLLDATRRITPVIRAHRAHAERDRCLAAPVVEAMAEAGLGVAVQSVQKVSVSSSFKINTLEGVL